MRRKAYSFAMRGLMALSVAITCGFALFIILYVLCKGLPNITWQLLSTSPSILNDRIGILPDILNTLYLILAALAVVLPLGVGAAVYLTEYASSKRLVSVIEYAAETLSGIPSIIYGFVGMMLFAGTFGTSLLAGALTLVIMNLPTVMRTAQESLKTVPQSYREGAFGLGAGKWRVVRGRRDYRLHTVRGAYSGRVGGAALHCRVCPCTQRLLHRAGQLRGLPDGCHVRLRQRPGRV